MMLLENPSTGTSAQTNIRAINNLGSISQLGIYGGSATAYGAIGADTAYLYGNTATLNLMSDNANGIITFATGGNSEKVRIDKSGNVGIGTTGPVNKLQVVTGTPADGLLMTYDSSNQYRTSLNVSFAAGTAASNKLSFKVSDGTTTGQTTVMTLAGNGYVGIGTTTPAYPLQIVGDAPSPNYSLLDLKPSVGAANLGSSVGLESRYLSTTQNWFWSGRRRTPNTNNFRIVDITAGNLDRININTSGNVGIGTKTQGGRLVVKGVGTTTGLGFQTQNSSGTELVTMLR